MNIVNVVNFVRASDYRFQREKCLETIRKQMELTNRYQMPTTFLLQPDCFWDREFLEQVEIKEYVEVGLWLEINKALVEEAGCCWKLGEKEWDWKADTDFSLSYSVEDRRKITDHAMEKFKEYFGYYPKTVGSWAIDAVTLAHLEQKYHVMASFNCKEQWGTDGYSLWGGYYGQGFYPCKKNAFTPAQSKKEQISIPVFRMLGCDPILQYEGICGENGQEVITLEPAAKGYGDNRQWVEWFFREMTQKEAMSFGYAQTGQENAFCWEWQGKGYSMQMEILNRLWKEGKLQIWKACDTGRWYQEHYQLTPVSVVQGERDGKIGIWYSSKRYRLGFYGDEEKIYIRDLMLFDENYRERYLEKACETKALWYDNLPLADSYRWRQDGQERTGIFMEKNGKCLKGPCKITGKKVNDTTFEIKIRQGEESMVLCLEEERIVVLGEYCLCWKMGNSYGVTLTFGKEEIEGIYENMHYHVKVKGRIHPESRSIEPVEGRIELSFV